MKVFLSLPFGERDEVTIRSHIEDMKKVFDQYYRLSSKQPVEYVHNYDCVLDKDKVYNKTSVGYLGYALEQLAQCDAIMFGLGNEGSEGCKVEKYVAKMYKIKMYDEGEIIKYLQRRETLLYCKSDPNKVQVQIKYLREGMKPLECHGNFIDVYTPEDVTIPAQGFKLIKLGVAMKVPEGYWCQLVPRSSTFKNYHILMANSFGVIDTNYCGDEDEWMFAAFNPMDEEETKIPAGTRIAQFRVVKDIPTELVTVTHLSDVNRGGFGSTGK